MSLRLCFWILQHVHEDTASYWPLWLSVSCVMWWLVDVALLLTVRSLCKRGSSHGFNPGEKARGGRSVAYVQDKDYSFSSTLHWSFLTEHSGTGCGKSVPVVIDLMDLVAERGNLDKTEIHAWIYIDVVNEQRCTKIEFRSTLLTQRIIIIFCPECPASLGHSFIN